MKKEDNKDKMCELMVSLDDEYFLNCILELEDLISSGWVVHDKESVPEVNTMMLTLSQSA